MNERIKELAEVARRKPMGNSWTYAHLDEFEQRFAELIVKECMTFFDNNKQVMNVKSPVATPSTMLKVYWEIEK